MRPLAAAETRRFLEVHHLAVHGLAAGSYPSEVADAWAPVPITEEMVAMVAANPDGETRLAAELDGKIVGIGVVIPANSELRACYVAPAAARRGVGTSLVREMEAIARRAGVGRLELASSLGATSFYEALGYENAGPIEHTLTNGLRMQAIRMGRTL